jgi:hypothetical protein
MLDSYEALIPEYITKEEFFRYGVEKTICIPDSKIKDEWDKLRKKLENNKAVFTRGSKASAENQLIFDFYKTVFKNDSVKKDPSNTQNPTKVMDSLSGYTKKDLKNYQLFSPFAKSKNALCFCAPWNIVYIPKILEPLLSAEASSPLAKEFKEYFLTHLYKKFKTYIDEYNKIVTNDHFVRSMDDYFRGMYENTYQDKAHVKKFEEVMYQEFAAIKV